MVYVNGEAVQSRERFQLIKNAAHAIFRREEIRFIKEIRGKKLTPYAVMVLAALDNCIQLNTALHKQRWPLMFIKDAAAKARYNVLAEEQNRMYDRAWKRFYQLKNLVK